MIAGNCKLFPAGTLVYISDNVTRPNVSGGSGEISEAGGIMRLASTAGHGRSYRLALDA